MSNAIFIILLPVPKPSLGHEGVPKYNLGTRIKKEMVAQAFQSG
jgi:hypothetical protein